MGKSFRLGQKVFLFNNEEKVLICKFNPSYYPKAVGKWDFPGGKLEFDESREEGLRRELREELGNVDYELGEPVVVWDWVLVTDADVRVVCVGIEGRFLGGRIELGEEHEEYRWVDVDELEGFDWFESDFLAINKLKEKYGK